MMPHRLEEALSARGIERRRHPRSVGQCGEHLVARRDLSQMHVGFNADALERLQSFGHEAVVEILGHRIRIGPQSPPVGPRCRDRRPLDDLPDPGDELLRGAARRHLGGELVLLARREHMIEPGQERAKRQTHDGHSTAARGSKPTRAGFRIVSFQGVAPGPKFRSRVTAPPGKPGKTPLIPTSPPIQ